MCRVSLLAIVVCQTTRRWRARKEATERRCQWSREYRERALWPRKRSWYGEDSYEVGVEASTGWRGQTNKKGSWWGGGYMITGDCVFSSGSCRFRHEARSILSSLRGEDWGRSLIQLCYMAIVALQPRLPSVIPWLDTMELMNKANSAVMSPFRNALSPKLFDGFCVPFSFSLVIPLTMGYQNALLFDGGNRPYARKEE